MFLQFGFRKKCLNVCLGPIFSCTFVAKAREHDGAMERMLIGVKDYPYSIHHFSVMPGLHVATSSVPTAFLKQWEGVSLRRFA